MRTLILILLWAPVFAQDPYTAKWTTSIEGVTVFEVQQSSDNNNWNTLAYVSNTADTSTYNLPFMTDYYRIKAGDIISNTVYMKVYNVFVSGLLYKSSSLTWSTTGEQNVSYYLIEKTTSGKTTQVSKVFAKGSSKYTYKLSKTVNKYTYRITPVYKDGSKGVVANF